MELSIVTTMYHSSPYLGEFYERIRREADKITSNYEIIFVNDGSPDASLKMALGFQKEDKSVVVVDLSRNFGHHRAMMKGLSFAQGDKVFLIDCDLEEKPELLTEFYNRFKKGDCDVVYGVQDIRKGRWFERISGSVFFSLMNMLSTVPLPQNSIVARLMSRRYNQSLLEHKERELFILGIWQLTGYDQVALPVVKGSRKETTYNFRKKLASFVNAVTSFSDKPLYLIFVTGLVIWGVSAAYICFLLIQRLFFLKTLDGWTSLIVSVWFLGGMSICFVGILGIYISKIFIETKNRPFAVVRKIYRFSDQ